MDLGIENKIIGNKKTSIAVSSKMFEEKLMSFNE